MVDSSDDAKISAEEWKEGCAKGWVSADANTNKAMEGTPAEPKDSSMDSSSDDSDDMKKSSNDMKDSTDKM